MSMIAQFARGAATFAIAEPRQPTQSPADRVGASIRSGEPIRGWSDVVDELHGLRRLEDDWDGQGAEAPAPEVVDAALRLALELRSSEMTPADRVVAGVNGTIFFEWHDPKQYLEIEVLAPDHAEGRWVFTDTNIVEEFTLSR